MKKICQNLNYFPRYRPNRPGNTQKMHLDGKHLDFYAIRMIKCENYLLRAEQVA